MRECTKVPGWVGPESSLKSVYFLKRTVETPVDYTGYGQIRHLKRKTVISWASTSL